MKTIRQIIQMADLMRENAIPETMKVGWISELDALIAADVMGMDILELEQFHYDPEADLDREPLVKFPHDNIYHYWLCAKIDAENGEYNRYQNSMQLYNAAFLGYRTWFSRVYNVFAGGRGVPTHYISAYGLAVQEGFPGTLQEWLLSLVGPMGPVGPVGPQGEPGKALEDLTEEELELIRGPRGYTGAAGVSPVVTVEDIEGGHKVTITDATGTNTIIVMDGMDGEDGVGIVSVEQTTTSNADGGSNVITVSLTDGQKATFTVKNGSKGDTGNGIKSAALNEDYTLTLTFDDGTEITTLSIRGATGAPGAHIGPEAPTNGEKIWIDTDKEEGLQVDITRAKVGQLLAVAEVDADGKPTKLVAVDPTKLVTPNWSANEGEGGYIEGRTHYVDAKGIVHKLNNKFIDADWMATSEEYTDPNVFIAEQTVSGSIWKNRQMDIQPGIMYDVHLNGVVYPCVAFNEDGGICIGNDTSLTANNLPFCIFWAGGTATSGFFYKNSDVVSSPISLKVTGHSWTDYNKLPEEFLPDGVVKSVNGNTPDEKGNVEVDIPDVSGMVKSVNGNTPDGNGNVEIEAGGGDWNANEGEAGYVKNRTHYDKLVELFPETTVEFDENMGWAVACSTRLVEGATYRIIYNGVVYELVCQVGEDMGGALFMGTLAWPAEDGEPPFGVVDGVSLGAGEYLVFANNDETYAAITVSVSKIEPVKIPQKYYDIAFYIDITGDNTDGYTTDAKCTDIEAAYAAGIPIFVRYADETQTYVAPLTQRVAHGTIRVYGADVLSLGINRVFFIEASIANDTITVGYAERQPVYEDTVNDKIDARLKELGLISDTTTETT